MKIRKDNDFVLNWAINWNGVAEDFTGATDMVLTASVFGIVKTIPDESYSIIGNIVRIEFTPEICNIPGVYRIDLKYSKPSSEFVDGERRSAVDVRAFKIVETSDQADTTQDISVTSDAVAGFALKYEDLTAEQKEELRGKGITSIELSTQDGDTKTYTITYADGETFDFDVADGHSPVFAFDGTMLLIDGVPQVDLKGETGNGIASVTLTSTAGLVKTYTITFTDATTATFTVTDGAAAVVQENGSNTSVVMSQKAVTDELAQLAGEISAKSTYQIKLDSTNIYPGKEQGWISATAITPTSATLFRCIIPVVQGDKLVFDVPNQSINGGYFYCFTSGRETDTTPDTTPIPFWNQHGVEVVAPITGYFQFNVQRDGINEGVVTVFKYIDDTTVPKRVVGMLNEDLTAIPSIDYDVASPTAQNGIIDILDYDIKLDHRGAVQLGGTMTRRESTIVGIVGNELEHISSAPSQGVKLYLTVNTDTFNVMNRSLVSPKAGDHITAFAVFSDIGANIVNPAKYSSFDLRISIKGSTTTSRIVKPKLTDIKKMTNGRYGVVWDYEITAEDITLATTHITCDGILIISAVAQTLIVSMPIFVHTRGKIDLYKNLGYIIQRLAQINNSTLTGKKWDQIGDSTTAMPATGLTGYVPYIFRKNYFQNCKLSGVGGSTVGGSSSTAFWQDSRIADIRSDADFVTISGGINDFAQNIPLGTEDSTDTTTFAGGLNTLLNKLFTKNVNYKIAFIAPYYINFPTTTNRENGIGLGIIDYVEMAEKVCARWGVPVRALHKRINVNPLTVGIYTQDTIHPNEAGYKAWGEDVADFFSGL